MINITRNGSIVSVDIATDLPHSEKGFTTLITLSHDEGIVYRAELLRRYLQNRLNKRIQDIRREAYESGWKDAKAHRSKQDWFDYEV